MINVSGVSKRVYIFKSVLIFLSLALLMIGCQNAPETIPAAEVVEDQVAAEVPSEAPQPAEVQESADAEIPLNQLPEYEGSAEPGSLPIGVAADEGTAGKTQEMVFTDKGVQPRNITITVGDTVIWKNNRTKTDAILRGTTWCSSIRSPTIQKDETFSWTFTEAGKCTLIDAIFTSLFMVVDVKEKAVPPTLG